jgi:hypothetical protein
MRKENYMYSQEDRKTIEFFRSICPEYMDISICGYVDETGKKILYLVEYTNYKNTAIITFVVRIPPQDIFWDKKKNSIYDYMHYWAYFYVPIEKHKLKLSLEEYQENKFWEGDYFFATTADVREMLSQKQWGNFNFFNFWKSLQVGSELHWRENGSKDLIKLPVSVVNDWIDLDSREFPKSFPPTMFPASITHYDDRGRRSTCGYRRAEESPQDAWHYFSDSGFPRLSELYQKRDNCWDFYIGGKEYFVKNILDYPEAIAREALLRYKKNHQKALISFPNISVEEIVSAGFDERYAKELLGMEVEDSLSEILGDILSCKGRYQYSEQDGVLYIEGGKYTEASDFDSESVDYYDLLDSLDFEKYNRCIVNGETVFGK